MIATLSALRLFFSQSSRFALPMLFAQFGMVMGTWASRIPAVREALHIPHSVLSLVLLCGGLGAVMSYPLSSRMMAGLGGRKTMLVSGAGLFLVLLAIGMAPTVPWLMAGLLMLGIAASVFDVAVNAVATKAERLGGSAGLSTLHACGCAGGLAGAALGSLMAGWQVGPALHFALLTPPLLAVLWTGYTLLGWDETGPRGGSRRFCLPRGPIALLGAIGFLGAMSEGSIADWSGIFLKDHFGVADGFAPLALSVFSVMMLATRVMGDRLKEKLGAGKLLSFCSGTAAAGLFLAVSAPNAYVALGGFALAGFGMALVFPFVFSAAGREGPASLAGVATLVYSGSLMGPPVIGTLAHGFGIEVAMAFVGVLSGVIAMIASRAALLK